MSRIFQSRRAAPPQELPLPPGEGRGEGTAISRKGGTFDPRSVSEFTASRLSVYLRCLEALESQGVRHATSQVLARRVDLGPAQIRKDLATFGEFGVRGVGYEVAALKQHLTAILGLDRIRRVAIVGAGHLGQALADYRGFRSGGFAIAGLFDNDPRKIGSATRAGVRVRDVESLPEAVAREMIRIGVVTVPASAAVEVARRCVAAGLKAILNFAPVRLHAPPDVRLKNVDLTINLETLSFYIPRE